MARMLVGFDPTRAQAAIIDLRTLEPSGVTWHVLNFMNNVNGAAPDEAATATSAADAAEAEPGLWQRLTGWLHQGGEESAENRFETAQPRLPEELTAEEIETLRTSANRAGMVMLIIAPAEQEPEVRKLLVRHGAFSLEPADIG